MKRTMILLLDSFGIGATADAHTFKGTHPDGTDFNDVGANTLGHIAKACFEGKAEEGRTGPLHIPNMNSLGFGQACFESSALYPAGLDQNVTPIGAYGYAKELSTGKDTSSGHWEIAGVPVLFDWGYFSDKKNSFPQSLLDELVKRADLPGYLGNCHSSGTVILEELGEEHLKTGKPIFYTSADSVFQIACHEESFGLERLYKLCELARELVDEYNIGRVIARPFLGTEASNFARSVNRHDYSVTPPAPTLLDKMKDSGGEVVSIGKISDIYAEQGITKATKAYGVDGLFDASLAEFKAATNDSIIFTNFVNFDADFGHRRNISGYAVALEYFDARLPEMFALLGEDDLLVLTADHGCDPTWPGSDHTREHIPVIFYGDKVKAGSVGLRDTFADIGQSIADFHDLPALDYGTTILK
ncbi:phosphopentomutase [Psychromonas sp. Urea-02u-13]|uniref:phosphopentomutase n=1 Tax=Psychromonas sp. Urea-02u-13 TaxID=2058326 RepID=UPI000C3465AD|nr:phosphopentomutase [Psychromonas sp. Urea-02u-13]PKG37806.1 phosphopentomutase [Psychromonas sp. Urea-02u-13]